MGELFLLGKATGTHGLRGDLKIRPLADNSDSLLGAKQVYLRSSGGEPQRFIPARVTLHKGNYLLRLQGLEEIGAVQPLVGCEVLMEYSDLADLPADEFYWFQLEGMAVADRVHGDLGTIEEVFTTAAHDIWVVRGPRGEVLIPAVDQFITEVNRETRQVTVDLPEGLIPDHDL
ncbi:MAG: 16S rRNA processing protein RimM [Desulfuromonadales bacterium]|nr:16S rRNA processing protein RimM [Desulfuromonadales bacterium]